jgi:hypothetical protein
MIMTPPLAGTIKRLKLRGTGCESIPKSDGSEPEWELIRLGMLSVADQAIFPPSGLYGAGCNTQNEPSGNRWG